MACSSEYILNKSAPGCFVSSNNIGKVYTSGAMTVSLAVGYESDDNANTLTSLYEPNNYKPTILSEYTLAGHIHVPFDGNTSSEYIVYYGAYDGTNRKLYKTDNGGATRIDITPEYDGEGYGPYKSIGTIDSWYDNNQEMVAVLANADNTKVGVWYSKNGGDTWINWVEPETNSSDGRIERVFLDQFKKNIYFGGKKGKIKYAQNLGDVIEDRTGDIDQLSVGEIIGITI